MGGVHREFEHVNGVVRVGYGEMCIGKGGPQEVRVTCQSSPPIAPPIAYRRFGRRDALCGTCGGRSRVQSVERECTLTA